MRPQQEGRKAAKAQRRGLRLGGLAACSAVVFLACGAPATPPADLRPAQWTELRITWGTGSAQQLLAVHYEGGFTATEGPTQRFSSLDSQEVRELHRVITGDFVRGLGSFDCRLTHDAIIRIELDVPNGTRKQEVAGCLQSSPPGQLVEMLEHHRSTARDEPPKHPKPPSGEGDPCDTGTGCGPGLMCVPAPCVVAPCTSGSCQRGS
jgi:hypothetical protein